MSDVITVFAIYEKRAVVFGDCAGLEVTKHVVGKLKAESLRRSKCKIFDFHSLFSFSVKNQVNEVGLCVIIIITNYMSAKKDTTYYIIYLKYIDTFRR